MKRLIWLLVAVAVVVAVLVGRRVYTEARLDAAMYKLLAAESPEETYSAAVDFLSAHPDLDLVRLDQVVGALTDAAFETGDIDGLVSSLETLRSGPLSARVADRLSAELHDALVFRSMMAPQEGDIDKADAIGRELLSSTELSSHTYMMMASLRSAMLADAPKRSTQWLTLELAWRAYGLSDSPDKVGETTALDGAVQALLKNVVARSSVENAIAVADSIGDALNDPTVSAILDVNRYRVSVDADPGLATVFARRLLDEPEAIQDWRILNGLGVDIRNRELGYDLALKLSELALPLTRARSDSQTVFNSIGWAYHKMNDEAEARRFLERSVALMTSAPTLEDSAMQRLLDVYEASGDYDAAIDMMAAIVARSVLPEEAARTRLADLVTKAGRSSDEIPELIATRRYSGVTQAPEFEALDASGGRVTLSQYSGSIVLLCFWSFG